MHKLSKGDTEILEYAQKLVKQESELITKIEIATIAYDFQTTETLGIEYGKIRDLVVVAKQLLEIKDAIDTGNELLIASNSDPIYHIRA